MTDDPFARAAALEADRDRERRERRAQTISSLSRTSVIVHVAVYLAVNTLLVAIWATSGKGDMWFIYPLAGWGIGLVAHIAAVSGLLRRPT